MSPASRTRVVTIALLALLFAPLTSWASATEKVGDALLVLLPLTGIVTATVKDDREGQIQFLKSLITNAAVTGALKAGISKRRPDGDCCDSFPSGHTSFAFMGASFLHKRYGSRFAIPAYTAAMFVGYSRVHSDRHFSEDVLVGAAIGYLSTYWFTTEYQGVTVTPVAGADFIGISIAGSW